jgi:hypothetical protein
MGRARPDHLPWGGAAGHGPDGGALPLLWTTMSNAADVEVPGEPVTVTGYLRSKPNPRTEPLGKVISCPQRHAAPERAFARRRAGLKNARS